MGYQPIQNYGIIGNMYTTTLVGLNGAIDWFCVPNHEWPSVFAALLDEHKGGYFQISSRTNDWSLNYRTAGASEFSCQKQQSLVRLFTLLKD